MSENKDDYSGERDKRISRRSLNISLFSLVLFGALSVVFFKQPGMARLLGGEIELWSGIVLALPLWVSAISAVLMAATMIFLASVMIQDIITDPESRGGLKGFIFFTCFFPAIGFVCGYWIGFVPSFIASLLIGLAAGFIWRKSDLMKTACTATGALFAFGAGILHGLGPASISLFLVYFLLSLTAKALKR